MKRTPAIKRFENNVYPEPNTGCWLWTGCVSPGKWGYGVFWVDGKTIKVHRYSYIIFKGEIPKGLFVCHSCDQPSCVNPDHLFLGTHQDNMKDMNSKGRGGSTKGERSRLSRLTTQQVLDIRSMYSDGNSSIKIAKRFSITDRNVMHIVNRETWKHI